MTRANQSRSKPGARAAGSTPAAGTPANSQPQLIARSSRDVRRWIYGGLDLVFALLQVLLIWKVVPNRLPSASFHLMTLPVMTLAMGIGMLIGGRTGWKIAIGAGSLALVSTVLLILRIVISAAFLSGVYGAFGKAAAMTAMMSVALLVELVALLPIVQVKYLMTRAGQRCFGLHPR